MITNLKLKEIWLQTWNYKRYGYTLEIIRDMVKKLEIIRDMVKNLKL